jgi:hypothetical protein
MLRVRADAMGSTFAAPTRRPPLTAMASHQLTQVNVIVERHGTR